MIREYNLTLNMFIVVSSIYDKYKPKGRNVSYVIFVVLK